MNRLKTDKRVMVLKCLTEGLSIRATVRLTGVSKNTVTKLLKDIGTVCAAYQDRVLVGLPCKRLEVDEIWAFCYAKQKNVPEEKVGEFGYGDVWTFSAIDAESKLIPCWTVGRRDMRTATEFMVGLARRLKHRVQLTTDGLPAYRQAVSVAFGGEIDFAQLVKVYRTQMESETRYSPPQCIGADKKIRVGKPRYSDVSTSYAERQHLTMRMQMRRFTRLTNGHSKKLANLCHALSLHFMTYNFARRHKSLDGATPAQAASGPASTETCS